MEQVTVGVRFHDPQRLDFLRRALVSISGQDGVLPHTVICCQDFSEEDLDRVRGLAKAVLGLSSFAYTVINEPGQNGRDLRSRLLNAIIEEHFKQGESQYLAFLDYDDIWFSHALCTLVAAHEAGRFALAYADVHCAHVHYSNRQFFLLEIKDFFGIGGKSKADIFVDNFLPLHAYLYNTELVGRRELVFDETISRLEDYDLLLRIASAYPVAPFGSRILIGLYNFYTLPGARLNTSQNIFDGQSVEKDPLWLEAMRQISKKVSDLPIHHFAGEMLAALKL